LIVERNGVELPCKKSLVTYFVSAPKDTFFCRKLFYTKAILVCLNLIGCIAVRMRLCLFCVGRGLGNGALSLLYSY